MLEYRWRERLLEQDMTRQDNISQQVMAFIFFDHGKELDGHDTPDEVFVEKLQQAKQTWPHWSLDDPLYEDEPYSAYNLLHIFCLYHKVGAMRWLLEHGANPNRGDKPALKIFSSQFAFFDYHPQTHLQGLQTLKDFGADFNQDGLKLLQDLLFHKSNTNLTDEVLAFYLKAINFEHNHEWWQLFEQARLSPYLMEVLLQNPSFNINGGEMKSIGGKEITTKNLYHVLAKDVQAQDWRKIEPTLNLLAEKNLVNTQGSCFFTTHINQGVEVAITFSLWHLVFHYKNQEMLQWMIHKFPAQWLQEPVKPLLKTYAYNHFEEGLDLLVRRPDVDWSSPQAIAQTTRDEELIQAMKSAYSKWLHEQLHHDLPSGQPPGKRVKA